MFAWCYDKYLDWMPFFDRLISDNVGLAESKTAYDGDHSGQSFKDIDTSATKLGKAYRGVGVLVGMLGIVIVFSAVVPVALQIENETWLRPLGALKVAMMLGMLVLVYEIGRKSGIKTRWIAARREAERLRYEELRMLKDALHAKPDNASAGKVYNELTHILDGKWGQILYNAGKAQKYKAIERASELLSWLGFGIGLVSAIWLLFSEFGWIVHRPWLIFGTAAVPAFVAGIHGINGFLNISALAEEHEKMAQFLRGISAELGKTGPKKTDPNYSEAILLIAERAYSQLVDRDVQWAESTKKVSLKPA
jgi:hypothetical protein